MVGVVPHTSIHSDVNGYTDAKLWEDNPPIVCTNTAYFAICKQIGMQPWPGVAQHFRDKLGHLTVESEPPKHPKKLLDLDACFKTKGKVNEVDILALETVLAVSPWFGGLKVTRQILAEDAATSLVRLAQQNHVLSNIKIVDRFSLPDDDEEEDDDDGAAAGAGAAACKPATV